VDNIDAFILIVVWVSVPAHLAPTSSPTSVCQPYCGHSRLTQHLFHHSVNAVYAAASLIGVFDQQPLSQSTPMAEDACAIVTSVFKQVHSIAEKLFKGDSLPRLLLYFLLGHRLLGHYAHDPTALGFLLLEWQVG